MSAQHKRIAVSICDDGIVLRPFDPTASRRERYCGPAVLISFGREAAVEALAEWTDSAEPGASLIVQGVADSYLILISSSSVVADLSDSASLSTVDELLSLPILPSARALLTKYVAKQTSLSTSEAYASTSDASSDEEGGTDVDARSLAASLAESGAESAPEADAAPFSAPKSFLRAPKKAFWRRAAPSANSPTLSTDSTAAPPLSAGDVKVQPSGAVEEQTSSETVPSSLIEAFQPVANAAADKEKLAADLELDSKIVKEVLRELKGMYFSSNIDITHSLQAKHTLFSESSSTPNAAKPASPFAEPLSHLPLWRRADKRFWWNAYLVDPFVKAGLHSYILVLQQGFIQQTSLSLPLQAYTTLSADPDPLPSTAAVVPLKLVIISRRSVERPGLRYQRRGVNVAGGVANFVETEFIIIAERDSKQHVASFLQTRGSIPVFWSQSPWALKPPPMLERTPTESNAALVKHFEKQTSLYGKQLIVNLAEATGKEATVVDAYRAGVEAMDRDDVKYVYWDFHKRTQGMKYENISQLITELQPDLEDFSCFWATKDQVFSTQSGVARVNCIDCLDRTNVVESAIARFVLNRQLVHLGVSSQEEDGLHEQLDIAFNRIWADNGDAISREYAGTSALKGDFTRTGKRNLRGALNDASNSVARLLQSTVSDFFKQATIDYVLGVNPHVFAEFNARLEASDPGEILRLAQIRQEAIDTSGKFVLSDEEEKVAGWTLLAPEKGDTVKSTKYEEKVLLLSSKAVYVVQYEYTLQKVVSFTRIPLGDIVGLQVGAYVLSALEPSARDTNENFGLIVSYHARDTTERVHTYSMRNKPPRTPSAKPKFPGMSPSISRTSSISIVSSNSSLPAATPGEDASDVHFFAFKALRKEAIRLGASEGGQSRILGSGDDEGVGKTARKVVELIVGSLREECEKVGAVSEEDKEWVKEKDIIGLAEAEAQTTILNRLGHKLQSLIWL